jgi:hypothetical protein
MIFAAFCIFFSKATDKLKTQMPYWRVYPGFLHAE